MGEEKTRENPATDAEALETRQCLVEVGGGWDRRLERREVETHSGETGGTLGVLYGELRNVVHCSVGPQHTSKEFPSA